MAQLFQQRFNHDNGDCVLIYKVTKNKDSQHPWCDAVSQLHCKGQQHLTIAANVGCFRCYEEAMFEKNRPMTVRSQPECLL